MKKAWTNGGRIDASLTEKSEGNSILVLNSKAWTSRMRAKQSFRLLPIFTREIRDFFMRNFGQGLVLKLYPPLLKS